MATALAVHTEQKRREIDLKRSSEKRTLPSIKHLSSKVHEIKSRKGATLRA